MSLLLAGSPLIIEDEVQESLDLELVQVVGASYNFIMLLLFTPFETRQEQVHPGGINQHREDRTPRQSLERFDLLFLALVGYSNCECFPLDSYHYALIPLHQRKRQYLVVASGNAAD